MCTKCLFLCPISSRGAVRRPALREFPVEMKLITWNINGIRTVQGSFKAFLDSFDADIICLQETKVTREMLEDSITAVEGYSAYFSHSRKRGGYSGVVTYCRDSARPIAAEEGLSNYYASLKRDDLGDFVGGYGSMTDLPSKQLQELDQEGRAIITEHRVQKRDGKEGSVCVVNVYCPRADKERDDRKAYKLWFCEMLQLRTEALLRQGKHVVVVGDLNTSHKPIDTCDSSGGEYASCPTRVWLNGFLCDTASGIEVDYMSPNAGGRLVDTFRYMHPDREQAYTCWSTATGARTLNYGCRIDYILADYHLAKETLRLSDIMPGILGSDHCPVMSSFDVVVIPATKCPSLCAKWMPEFTGKQQKLSSFFQKAILPEENPLFSQPVTKRLRLSDAVSTASVKASLLPVTKKKSDSPGSGQKSLLDFFGKTPKTNADFFFPAQPDALTSTNGPIIFDVEEKFETHTNTFTVNAAAHSQPVESSQTDVAIAPESQPTPSLRSSQQDNAAQWRSLLRGPEPPPLCSGHGEPCILKTCRKAGPNRNRQFYMCAKPEGAKTDINARCGTFRWIGKGSGGGSAKK